MFERVDGWNVSTELLKRKICDEVLREFDTKIENLWLD